MKSERTHKALAPSPAWLALVIVACSGSDAHVGCDPSLACSLHPASFEPQRAADAGPPPCSDSRERCPAAEIVAGDRHGCVKTKAGQIICWGDDSEGQRGDAADLFLLGGMRRMDAASGGDEGGVLDAALVLDASTARGHFVTIAAHAQQVTTGAAHTCLLDETASVRCWGRNADGQVNGSTSGPVLLPARVQVEGATQISAGGAHTCALTDSGVWCWGSARFGQVGREIKEAALAPGLVVGTEGAVQVAAGLRHTCARLQTGHVLCWGELIDALTGQPRATAQATEVPAVSDATTIAAGAGHTCALRKSGEVWCWGANASGQLGDGTTTARARPVHVQGLQRVLRIATGGFEDSGLLLGHSCATDTGFFMSCWGRNAEGQLGIGAAADQHKALLVAGRPDDFGDPYLRDIVAIATGAKHTCAIDHDGPALCWGDNGFGQLGVLDQRFGRAARVARFGR